MTEAEELKQCFHQCMPFFIALGDEIRLTIVEALTEAASRRCGGDYSMENLSLHGLNVKEITEYTAPIITQLFRPFLIRSSFFAPTFCPP